MSARSFGRSAAIAACVSIAALAACGQPEPHEYFATYDPPGGEFRLRYLHPPWELVASDGPNARLEIANNVPDDIDGGSTLPEKYVLDVGVDVAAGGTLASAQAEERAARRRGEEILVPVREVATDAGDEGHELITVDRRERERFFRTVWLARPPAGAARPPGHVELAFAASPSLDEPEVDAMIAAFEVGR